MHGRQRHSRSSEEVPLPLLVSAFVDHGFETRRHSSNRGLQCRIGVKCDRRTLVCASVHGMTHEGLLGYAHGPVDGVSRRGNAMTPIGCSAGTHDLYSYEALAGEPIY